MGTTTESASDLTKDLNAYTVDLKLEVVVIPVADVDRSKDFYSGLGWRLDADFGFDNGFRVVQFTPPGSPSSVQFGTMITTAAPGSAQGLYLVVSDVQAARDQLAARGVSVSDVFHPQAHGAQFQPEATMTAQAARRQTRPATARSPRSPTRMAMAGCCRKSRPGCPAASTPRTRPTAR